MTPDPGFLVRAATSEDAAWMQASFAHWWAQPKPAGYFAAVIAMQNRGEARLFVASVGEHYAGHCKLIWQPDYPPFRKYNIPEVQDLNVMPPYRRRGIGAALMSLAEASAAERVRVVGVGVGLYADYGPAQQLYVRRGYIPDGYGVHYRDEPVPPGARVPVDDDLVLCLVKRLYD